MADGEIRINGMNGKFIHIRIELLGILLVILLQTFGAIWWAARTEQRLENLEVFNTLQADEVEGIHTTQVQILQELARLRQAIEDSECFGGGG